MWQHIEIIDETLAANALMKMKHSAIPGKRSGRGKPLRKHRSTAEPARFYYKGNRLKQLRAFCYAVKFGSIARAAEALFLSPSSVSLQLSALEKELGAHLL